MKPWMPSLALVLVLLATTARAQEDPLAKLDAARVEMRFDDVSVEYVLEFLSTQLGVPILLDPEVQVERSEESLQITIQLGHVRGRTALEGALLLVDLGYDVEGPVILVRLPGSVLGRQVTEIHDVGDLVGIGDTFEGRSDYGEDEPDGYGEPLRIDMLQALIEENVAPGTWDAPNSIAVRGRRLTVRHSPEVQEQVRRLLATLREGSSRQVELEVSVYRLDEPALRSIRTEGTFPPQDLPRRLDALVARPGSDLALVARLLAVSSGGQPATIQNALETPYVSGQRPVAAVRTGAVEPEFDWTMEPFDVEAQPIVTDEGRTIWLRLVLDAVRQLPGRTLEAPHGILALPSSRRQRVETVASFPADRCFVAEVGASGLVVVRPTVRRIEGLEPPAYEPTEAETRRAAFIERLRAKSIEVRFHDRALTEVLDTIRRSGGFDVLVAREVAPEVLRAPLTLEMASISVWDLLQVIARIDPVEVQLLDEVVVLRGAGHAPGRSILRAYDLQQQTVSAQESWLHAELGGDGPARRRSTTSAAVFDDDGYGSAQVTQEEIEELIRSSVDPEEWEREGSGMNLVRGRLIVSAPPETQERVAAFLAALRPEVEKGARFRLTRFWAPPELLAEFAPAEGSRVVLAPGVAERLLARLGPGERAETYSVAGNLHRWIAVGRSDAAAYVADLRSAVAEESNVFAPGSGTYRTGASFRVSALENRGGGFLVSIDALTATLTADPARYVVEGQPLEGPRVSRSRAVLTVPVEPGQSLLVPVGAPTDAGGGVEHVLVEVERLGD